MRYAIVIEKAAGNYSVYVPDLPGCVATAATVEAVEEEIREAIRFHIDGLKEDGLPIPEPTSMAEYAEVEVQGFFGKMVRAGVVKGSIDMRRGYTLAFVNKRVGIELRPKN